MESEIKPATRAARARDGRAEEFNIGVGKMSFLVPESGAEKSRKTKR
jgi:hypothetical protein